ncbi:MAG: glycine zipper 2TM domain-containing protein [Burkholderiaceae bacterium]
MIICFAVALATGCASHSVAPDSLQSSTTGTILVRTGYVSGVQDVTIHDHSRSSAAPAVGALVGGVAGSLIGSGSSRVLGTLGGAAGGSLAAQQLARPEISSRKKVTVRFEDGTSQIYEVGAEEPFRVGEAVKIVNRAGNIQVLR